MSLEAFWVVEGETGILHKLSDLSNMVADDFTGVVYQRSLHDIASLGW